MARCCAGAQSDKEARCCAGAQTPIACLCRASLGPNHLQAHAQQPAKSIYDKSAPKVPRSRRCMSVMAPNASTSGGITTPAASRSLVGSSQVVGETEPRKNPVENATCANRGVAQVEIPTDSGPAICTGRYSVRFLCSASRKRSHHRNLLPASGLVVRAGRANGHANRACVRVGRAGRAGERVGRAGRAGVRVGRAGRAGEASGHMGWAYDPRWGDWAVLMTHLGEHIGGTLCRFVRFVESSQRVKVFEGHSVGTLPNSGVNRSMRGPEGIAHKQFSFYCTVRVCRSGPFSVWAVCRLVIAGVASEVSPCVNPRCYAAEQRHATSKLSAPRVER